MSPAPARAAGPRIPRWVMGVALIVLTFIAFWLAFSTRIPFTPAGYQVKAVFSDAQGIRVQSPVRIAGVDVGQVTDVEHLTNDGEGQQAAVLTMRIDDGGQPVREDATMQLRPRLFLEGNLFVDLQPGTPEGEELEDGGTIPISQTSHSVQLDQILTSLQAPVRESLQTFLVEFGAGLDTYGGGEGFRESFRTSPAAFRHTAEVNEAFLGRQPGDLAGLIVNLDRTVRALNQDPAGLQDLVTNVRIVTGSFGAESEALEAAIVELPGVVENGRSALAKLNTAFPPLRAFAREALPGVRSAPRALRAATPFVRQLRALASRRELRGLARDLRRTIPPLALLVRRNIPFLEQSRALSSCFNEVIIPWSNDTVPDPDHPATGRIFEETGYGLTGISGESRSGDANGQIISVAAGGGQNTVAIPSSESGFDFDTFGTTLMPIQGARPAIASSRKTDPADGIAFKSGGTIVNGINRLEDVERIDDFRLSAGGSFTRPAEACENQDPPNLNTGIPGDPPASAGSARSSGSAPSADDRFSRLSPKHQRALWDFGFGGGE